jgi:DNA-binding response OmpR family regulator
MTVLLVDPADGDAAILASALRVEGFEVFVAKTVPEARAVLGKHPIVLTLLDLMIRNEEGKSGLDFARELRIAHPAMRVVLTSSYHLSERQLERAHCGVSGFIPKPYDLREVVEFVRTKTTGPPSSRRVFVSEPTSGVTPIVDEDDGAIATTRR